MNVPSITKRGVTRTGAPLQWLDLRSSTEATHAKTSNDSAARQKCLEARKPTHDTRARRLDTEKGYSTNDQTEQDSHPTRKAVVKGGERVQRVETCRAQL